MGKSIYATLSRDKHFIFVQRLKSLCKEKHLTYNGLAIKLEYSEDTIKGWTRKNGGFPNIDVLAALSCIFNVDVAYLLGEQDCRKIESQRIVDLTGLSEKTAAILLNDTYTSLLDEIMSHKDFPRLLHIIWQFSHSHNANIKIEDNSLYKIDYFPVTQKKTFEMLKFTASDTFSKILDSIWLSHKKEMEDSHDLKIISDLCKDIHQYSGLVDTNSEARRKMMEIIELKISNLKSESFSFLKDYPADNIYQDYKILARTFHVNLDEKPPID